MTFRKSGKSYEFSPDAYRKTAIADVVKSFEGDADRDGRAAVLAAANAKIKAAAEEAGIDTPATLTSVTIRFEDNSGLTPDTLGWFDTEGWDGFVEAQKDYCESDGDDQFPERTSEILLGFLNGIAFDQNGRRLDVSDGNTGIVKAEVGGTTGYFYTRHETSNGAEIWYKAVDPMSWYGVETRKAGK